MTLTKTERKIAAIFGLILIGVIAGCAKNAKTPAANEQTSIITDPAIPSFDSNQPRTNQAVRCSANFSANDAKGNASTATLKLFNGKSVTPRAEQSGDGGYIEISYTLKSMATANQVAADADVRADEIYCTVVLESSGEKSNEVSSERVIIADTKPEISLADANASTSQTLDRLGATITPVSLSASDADGDSITYSFRNTGCGSGIAVNASTGVVSGTIPAAGSQSNAVGCTVSIDALAADAATDNPVQLYFEAANNSPSVSCTNNYQTLTSGSAATAMACSGTDIDLGTTMSYSLSGCSTLSINSSTGAVTGTMPTFGCRATVTVSDGAAQGTSNVELKLSFTTLPQGIASYNDMPSNTVQGIHIDGNTIYAATDRGIGKSTDGGATWSALTAKKGFGSDYVFDVTGSGSDIYVASNVGFGVSHDSGATWSYIKNVGDVYFSQGRRVEVIGSTVLYDGDIGNPARSTDKGATWTNLTISNGNITDYYFDAANNKVYASTYSSYATNSGGVQVSSDTGATWAVLGASTQLQAKPVTSVAVSNGVVFVAIQPSGSTVGGIAYTSDNGASWTLKNTLPTTSDYPTDLYVANNIVYLLTYSGLFTSSNNGDSWTQYSNLSGREMVVASTTLWLASTGVRKTTFADLNTYTQYVHNRVLPAGNIAVDSTRLYSGSTYSTDDGTTWNNWGGSFSGTSIADVYLSGFGAIYMAGSNGLSASTDNGTSWTRYTTSNGLPQNDLKATTIHNSSTIVVASTGGVSISTTPASSWTTKTTSNGLASNTVNDVTSDNSKIYAATSNGLSISADNGTSWTNYLTGKTVNAVFVTGGKIYAGHSSGLSISADGGATWTDYGSTSFPNQNSYVIYSVLVSASNILLGTRGGLVLSSDAGQTWVGYTETDGIPDRDWISSVGLYNNKIYTRSYYAGVAKSN